MNNLTPRQRQTLALAANGRTNTQIGHKLGVCRTTIDRHLAAIYKALGARDRAQAVAIALAVGELGVHQIHVPARAQES